RVEQGHGLAQLHVLEGPRYARAGDLALSPPGDVVFEKADLAFMERQRACDQIEHRGFASAIGPDEAQDLTGFESEAHIIDRNQPAKAACCPCDAQQWPATFGLLAAPECFCGRGQRGTHPRQVTQREGYESGACPL